MEMRIKRLEGGQITNEAERDSHLVDLSDWSNVEWKPKKNPSEAHTVPFITGKHYHISWGTPEDFTDFKIEVSKRWDVNDANTYFTTNYTNQREEFSLRTEYGSSNGVRLEEGTLTDYSSDQDSGDNRFVSIEKRFEFVINGKDIENSNHLLVEGWRCLEDDCPVIEIVDGLAIEDQIRRWSLADSWSYYDENSA